jgi:hypothetical protein
MIKNVYWPSCKVPVILVRFLMKFEISRQIFKKHSSYLMKIRPVGDQFSKRTNRRTDMQLVIAFRDSASAPKNLKHEVVLVCIQHCLKMYTERERGFKTSYILNLEVRGDACGQVHVPFSLGQKKYSPTDLPAVRLCG